MKPTILWTIPVALAAAIGAVMLSLLTPAGNLGLRATTGPDRGWYLGFVVYVVVGAVIVRRVPGNPVGWAAWGLGSTASVAVFCQEYARVALVGDTALPLGAVASWLAFGLSPVAFLLFLPAFLLRFPTGRPVSARWRAVEALVVVDIAAVVVAWLAAWPVRGLPLLVTEDEIPGAHVTNAIGAVALPLGIVLILVALVSVAIRFRRSEGVERLQLRWFFAGTVTVIVTILVTELSPTVGARTAWEWLNLASFCVLPVAVGMAMVRYRLYDLDRIISRLAAWALVTAVLLGGYLSAVLVLGAAARTLTGEEGDLVVALSTLTVAAVARPLLGRIQDVVDRRFDRARYDAARTIDAFGRTLRDEVSLSTVVDQLRRAAASTFLPESAGVVLVETSKEAGQP